MTIVIKHPTIQSPMNYTAVIREQITREVEQLTSEFRKKYRVSPQYIELGYLLNSHKGLPVFQKGDKIQCLPIKIDQYAMRSISLKADDVLVSDTRDADDEYDDHPDDRYESDCVLSTTW